MHPPSAGLRPFATLLAFACGCSAAERSPDRAREALIVQTLVETDRDLIDLRPDLVATKYAAMAATPQTFLRGTAPLFYRDYARQRPVRHGDGAERVQLYGDVHLENAGASFDESGMLFEITDFDATVRGPFDWEVRRAGLAVATALGMAGHDAAIPAAADALAAGYLEGLAAAPAPLRSPLARVWDDLLADAQTRLARREDLTRYTVVDNGHRRILRDADTREIAAPFGEGLADAITRYRATRRGGPGDPAAFVVKDAAQRYNSGIASLANVRLWLLVEGPPGEADDLLLELKEQRDPPLPIALLDEGPTSRPPFSNGERIRAGFDRLASSPTLDPDYGVAFLQGLSFQVRSVTRGRRNLDVADLAAYNDNDLAEMAHLLGRLVGQGHARTADPKAILAAIGPTDAWRRATVDAALADRAQLLADLDLFRSALATRGPLLGARR